MKKAAMNTGYFEDGPDIKCFKIEGESGYSEFWRRDKSPVKAHELTKLLIALRKIVSHVGRNAGTVSWKDTIESELMVDPGPVMGKYPVPASKTDALIGETIRQAYRSIEMSEYAGKRAKSALDLSLRFIYKFDLYFSTCENVYADCLANNRIFGIYVEKSRKNQLLTALDATSHPPALAELFAIWWEIASDRSGQKYLEAYKDTSVRKTMGRASLETFYKIPVQILNDMVPALIHDCPKISGVTERCEFRARLYVDTWNKLFPIIKFWPIDNSDVFLQARKEEAHQLKGMKKSLSLPELIFSEKLGKVIKKEPEPSSAKKKKPANDDSVVAVEMNPIVLPAKNYVNKK
ncbi:MAG: VWA domain-containing protein, partial [Desulfobacula sp.]